MFGAATAVAPLAPMVTVAVFCTRVALSGLDNVTVKFRVGAAPARSKMGTVMFCTVCPGPKVSVPLVAV